MSSGKGMQAMRRSKWEPFLLFLLQLFLVTFLDCRLLTPLNFYAENQSPCIKIYSTINFHSLLLFAIGCSISPSSKLLVINNM